MKQYLLENLRERSTWRGLVMIATACGIVISPEQAEAITAGGLFLVGLIGAALKDKK